MQGVEGEDADEMMNRDHENGEDLMNKYGTPEDPNAPNADLWEIFDPTVDNEVPYVYEYFEWSHCQEEGYPLSLVNASDVRDDDAFLEHATR